MMASRFHKTGRLFSSRGNLATSLTTYKFDRGSYRRGITRYFWDNHTFVRSLSSSGVPINHDDVDSVASQLVSSSCPINNNNTLLEIMATSSDMIHTPVEPMSWYNLGQYVMNAVHLAHDVTGMTYASSIVIVTIMGRVFLLPIGVWSRRNQSRRDSVEPQIRALHDRIQKTHDGKTKQRLAGQIKALFEQSGYNPRFRFAAPFVTIGTFITMWYGLRWMGEYYPTEMATGGVLWFVDLSQPDQLYFLPIWSTMAFFVHGELGADSMGRPSKELSWRQLWFWRSVRVILTPILMGVPASVHCFWIPNTMMGIGQSVWMSQPAVMKKLGINSVPKEAVQSSRTLIDVGYSKIMSIMGKEEKENNEVKQPNEKQNDEIVFYKDAADATDENKPTSDARTQKLHVKKGKKRTKRKK